MSIARFEDHPERRAALAAGLKTFDPGEPCKHGHRSPRYVRSNSCVACAKVMFAKWKARHAPTKPPRERRERIAVAPPTPRISLGVCCPRALALINIQQRAKLAAMYEREEKEGQGRLEVRNK